MEVAGEELDN
jgi:hypothetical protein